MIRALLCKEWREHRWVVLALWGLVWAFTGFRAWRELDVGSPFLPFQRLLPFALPLLCLAVANRLVVREYTGKTQLFLEALPLTPARVLGTKWLLGATWVCIPLASQLVGLAARASAHTSVTLELLLNIAARTFTFALCFYALAFTLGLLGRYRYVGWGVVVGIVWAIDRYSQEPVLSLAPLGLVAPSMVVEREPTPWDQLALTAALIAAFVGCAAVLALAREGAWVAALAHRMSRREKVAVIVAATLPLSLVATLDARKPKPAFDLLEAVRAKASALGLVVGIARASQLSEADARELGSSLAGDLEELGSWLGLSALPAVFVLPDASLDVDAYQRADLPDADGVVLKAPLGRLGFQTADFRVFAVHEVLTWYARARNHREARHWLLDGYSAWWVAREEPAFRALLEGRADAATHLVPLDVRALERWGETQETLGDCLGTAFAYRGVTRLMQQPGARELLREVLGTRPVNDIRAALRAGPVDAKLSAALAEALRDAPKVFGPAPKLLGWKARYDARPVGTRLYEVEFVVRRPDAEAKAPFTVRYDTLDPWTPEVGGQLPRVDATQDGYLPVTPIEGTRLFTAVEKYDADLQCTVRIGARRWEVR